MTSLFRKMTFLLSCFVVFVSCNNPKTPAHQENNTTKQNLIIILTDDMGYGDISAYGNKQFNTPNIDKLASQGAKLTDFYVPVPYCAPSRATLLTGRFPLRHGLVRNPAPDSGIDSIGISTEERTLGEVLQSEGYTTKLIGKWHLGHLEEYFPVNHGFDEYYGILYSNDMRPVQIVENKDTVEYPVDQRLLTKKYTEKAIEFIRTNKDKPFFLHFAHAMPHKPLAASKDFYTPETPDDLYNDVINEVDWSVGQVIKTLDELGLAENTILIFMSDNGPSWGGSTGGLKGMKGRTWEGGTRVPFIIRANNITRNATISTPAWSPDIFPTVLNMLGISLAADIILDGENIFEILTGDKTTHNPIFTMRGNQVMTIRKGEWKLFLQTPRYEKEIGDNYLKSWTFRNPDDSTILAPREQYDPRTSYPGILPADMGAIPLLFNMKEDPTETKNLANDHPEIIKELQKEYEVFVESIEHDNLQ